MPVSGAQVIVPTTNPIVPPTTAFSNPISITLLVNLPLFPELRTWFSHQESLIISVIIVVTYTKCDCLQRIIQRENSILKFQTLRRLVSPHHGHLREARNPAPVRYLQLLLSHSYAIVSFSLLLYFCSRSRDLDSFSPRKSTQMRFTIIHDHSSHPPQPPSMPSQLPIASNGRTIGPATTAAAPTATHLISPICSPPFSPLSK